MSEDFSNILEHSNISVAYPDEKKLSETVLGSADEDIKSQRKMKNEVVPYDYQVVHLPKKEVIQYLRRPAKFGIYKIAL